MSTQSESTTANKPRPEGFCTDCDRYTFSVRAINEPCGNTVGKKRCKGVYKSNMKWDTCPSCNGTGKPTSDDTEAIRNETRKCSSCQGSGWLVAKRKRPSSAC